MKKLVGSWFLVLGSWFLVLGSWFFESIGSKVLSTKYQVLTTDHFLHSSFLYHLIPKLFLYLESDLCTKIS